MVTFGTLVQLVLEGRSAAELRGHLALLDRMGMSATLAALGQATLSARELATVAELTLAAPYAELRAHARCRFDSAGHPEADTLGQATSDGSDP